MKGGDKKFVQLCDSPFYEIQEQAILGIGNLATDSILLRDRLIEFGALDKVLFYLKTSENRNIIKTCSFCLTNFAKGTPSPPYEKMCPFLDFCVNLMRTYQHDQEIIIDCIWVLGYLAENYKKSLKSIYDSKILPMIVTLLK